MFGGQCLNVHAALHRAHREPVPLGPVDQQREVVFLGDVDTFGDHDRSDGVTLDVHTEDLLRGLTGRFGRLHDLHPARLAAATGLDLRLDHRHWCAQPLRRVGRLIRGRGHDTSRHWDAMGLEQISRLILEKIHLFSLPAPGSELLHRRVFHGESLHPCRPEVDVHLRLLTDSAAGDHLAQSEGGMQDAIA